jgi:predicted RNase H-like nuclease (RuvC/YqgF family)
MIISMEILFDILSQPFTWGLLIGLGLVFFVWRAGAKDKKYLKSEVKRFQDELATLQNHLSTQLKINAEGNNKQQKELEQLREQNENLRVNLQAIQQKPGKLEMRKLEVTETAVSVLREQAPGFAAAWEKALREAEDDYVASESGLKKLIRKVNPGFRATADTSSKKIEDKGDLGI